MTSLIFTSGLKARKSRANKWLYSLCLLSTFVYANEPDSPADVPDLELLEFLAEWDDGQGNWLDPIRLSDALGESMGKLTEEQDND